jgi:DNA processing protein
MDYPLYEVGPERFPGALTEIPDPPKKLYIRGALPPSEHALLAVVGSRAYSTYGRQAVESLIGGLSGYPITIVSGLAIGIDALAHKTALTHRINTIAVPGSGISDAALYPRQNKSLGMEILKAGGALLSEFDPDFRATHWSFPQRNRIMAGIARATLVIEATEKSGTLITARLAADYNRDLLVVPGSIFSENSKGPHLFMKIGATPITSAHDLIEALGFSPERTAQKKLDLSPQEHKIYDFLASPQSRDAIIASLGMPAEEINAHLMLMVLRGHLIEKNSIFTRASL